MYVPLGMAFTLYVMSVPVKTLPSNRMSTNPSWAIVTLCDSIVPLWKAMVKSFPAGAARQDSVNLGPLATILALISSLVPLGVQVGEGGVGEGVGEGEGEGIVATTPPGVAVPAPCVEGVPPQATPTSITSAKSVVRRSFTFASSAVGFDSESGNAA